MVYVTATKTGKNIDFDYLTPIEEPLKFEIPRWMFKGKRPDEITTRQVVEKFRELMSLPFEIIPPAPLDVPVWKIPPHKRDKLVRAKEKARLIELGPESPFEGGVDE